jgi:hypothetical protein
MSLKTREALPPGGWIYTQPQTGLVFREMSGFGEVAKKIQIHRMSNNLPGATLAQASEDLDEATCQRLGNDPAFCQKKTPAVDGSPSPGPVDALLAVASKSKTGLQILSDWWGEGGIPVERHMAENRATVCAGCDQNKLPHFLEKITDRVGQAILEQMKLKRDMGMEVAKEAELKMCHVCRCHLPLKVWVPLKTILGRTTPEELKKFPSLCWILVEQKKSQITPIPI